MTPKGHIFSKCSSQNLDITHKPYYEESIRDNRSTKDGEVRKLLLCSAEFGSDPGACISMTPSSCKSSKFPLSCPKIVRIYVDTIPMKHRLIRICPTITYELQADPYRSGEAITTQEWHDLLKTQDFGQVVERDEFPPGRDVIQIRQPNRNSPPAQIISLHPDSSRKLDQQQQDPLTNPAKTTSSTAPSDSGSVSREALDQQPRRRMSSKIDGDQESMIITMIIVIQRPHKVISHLIPPRTVKDHAYNSCPSLEYNFLITVLII
ncbi:uncharacterized protein PGTG_09768 [Puccinia graminis f. sp. tritici CRL 75-36-700-3]|uniref:Uncharacterized protein n=1 Tax=Puccinia graminis f. sp. tritici (strain CRL 75-36-700-3 / race SCCL) TaxID=418459 RepID=E3KID0_PUCGT|nr:uncharacterized protein PGTG_09768 [Puccinia graminis f. sp. tritici CRL 75-36-700-3]EFP84055.1 hypothetical protein PGTG_09768 [Puccinia graminis f. sp. tritici CRL 75-36-700-3]